MLPNFIITTLHRQKHAGYENRNMTYFIRTLDMKINSNCQHFHQYQQIEPISALTLIDSTKTTKQKKKQNKTTKNKKTTKKNKKKTHDE